MTSFSICNNSFKPEKKCSEQLFHFVKSRKRGSEPLELLDSSTDGTLHCISWLDNVTTP